MGMNVKYEGSFLITRIHQTSGRIFETILRKYDLSEISPAQGRVLFALWKNDNVPIQELARQTSLSKSTLTAMIDRLEEQGFIARVPSEQGSTRNPYPADREGQVAAGHVCNGIRGDGWYHPIRVCRNRDQGSRGKTQAYPEKPLGP